MQFDRECNLNIWQILNYIAYCPNSLNIIILLVAVALNTVCSNSHSACGAEWVPCCPGGKGSIKGQVTCSTADCPDPGKPCTGGWMKDNCKQTCGLCEGGVIPGGEGDGESESEGEGAWWWVLRKVRARARVGIQARYI